jgi:hypothetical protein
VRVHLRRGRDVIAGDPAGNVRLSMATAPARPARSTIAARASAVALLALGLFSLVTLGSFAWGHRIDTGGVDAVPVKLPAATWRSLLTVAVTTGRACPPSVPVAVLYVNRSCAHCRAELDRWASLVRERAPSISCVGLVVASAPARTPSSTRWLPTELAPMLLWDHDGSIARALSVRVVPLVSFINSHGAEVSRSVGEVSRSSTIERLNELRRISGGAGAP